MLNSKCYYLRLRGRSCFNKASCVVVRRGQAGGDDQRSGSVYVDVTSSCWCQQILTTLIGNNTERQCWDTSNHWKGNTSLNPFAKSEF